MQPAFFCTRFPPPSAGATVLARLDGARAWRTADAGIAVVVKSVVRNVMDFDVRPYVVARPFQQRINFDQTIRVVPVLQCERLPRLGLLATKSGDPVLLPGQRSLQRLDLADVAALLTRGVVFLESVLTILVEPLRNSRNGRAVCS